MLDSNNGNGSSTTFTGTVHPAVEPKQTASGRAAGKVLHIQFRLNKATENTVQYREVAQPGQPKVAGTFYLQKWVVPQPYPDLITVTVSIPVGVDLAGRS